MSAELRALVEAVLPLEVIAAQHRAKPYRELSPELIDDINRAIGIVRAAIDARAALASTSIDGVSGTGLEDAWREAEAALPEGASLKVRHQPWNGYTVVSAQPVERPAPPFEVRASGPTPEAALRNLRAALAKDGEEGGGG